MISYPTWLKKAHFRHQHQIDFTIWLTIPEMAKILRMSSKTVGKLMIDLGLRMQEKNGTTVPTPLAIQKQYVVIIGPLRIIQCRYNAPIIRWNSLQIIPLISPEHDGVVILVPLTMCKRRGKRLKEEVMMNIKGPITFLGYETGHYKLYFHNKSDAAILKLSIP